DIINAITLLSNKGFDEAQKELMTDILKENGSKFLGVLECKSSPDSDFVTFTSKSDDANERKLVEVIKNKLKEIDKGDIYEKSPTFFYLSKRTYNSLLEECRPLMPQNKMLPQK